MNRIKVYIALAAIPLILIIMIFIISAQDTNKFWNDCERLGGHVVSTGRAYLCVSEDGRIIETM